MKKILFLLLFPIAALAQVSDGTISTNITTLSNMSSTYTNEKPRIMNILSELTLSKPNIMINPGYLYVGNGSSIATGVALSGDGTLSQAGSLAVVGIRGVSVSATSPTSNQVLQYNGSSWAPATLSLTTTLSGLTDANISSPSNGQFLRYQTSDNKWHNVSFVSGTDYQSPITFGTGVLTALGINIGSAGAPVLFNGALGTPSSGTLTNATGLPISGLSGLGSNWSTALGASLGSGWTTALNATYSSGGGNYQTIQNSGSSLAQRATFNFTNGLTSSDNSGSSRTDVKNNLITGISGGQTLVGGTGSGDGLTISATSNSTKGAITLDSYLTNNFSSTSTTTAPILVVPLTQTGITFQGGGWIVLNAAGSGYTSGSYNNVTFTYTSGTVATNLVLTGITISGGIATGTPLFYWVSGGVGADATTVWTASGIPGGSGFTVKTGTDYRSVAGQHSWTIYQSTVNADNQIDAVMGWGYNQNGAGGRTNPSEAAAMDYLEPHYLQASTGPYGQFERYFQTVSRTGNLNRHFFFGPNKQDGTSYATFDNTTYTFYNTVADGHNQIFKLDGTVGASNGVGSLQGTASQLQILNTTPTTGGTLTINGLAAGGGSIVASGGAGSLSFTNTGQPIALNGSTAVVTFSTGTNSANGLDIHQNASGTPAGVQITFGSQATQYAVYSSGNASSAARIDLINTNTSSGNSILNIQAGTSGTGKAFIDFQTGSALNMFVGTDASGVFNIGKTSGWGSNNFFSINQSGDIAGLASSGKWGMFGTSPVSQQSVLGILVNNVTSGGTTSTIANFTDLTIYANDAATIRNNDYQLAKKILALETALRNYGIIKD